MKTYKQHKNYLRVYYPQPAILSFQKLWLVVVIFYYYHHLKFYVYRLNGLTVYGYRLTHCTPQ